MKIFACILLIWNEPLYKWSAAWSGGVGENNSLRWFGHIERMKNEEFVKKVYMSELEDANRRGTPLGRWKDGVKECLNKRGVGGEVGIERPWRECINRERWRSFCHGHPLWEHSCRERGIKDID